MIRKLLALLGGRGFGSDAFPLALLLKYFIIQKVIGINRHVPWPVHWTSRVLSAQNVNHGSRCPGLSIGCHIDGRNGIHFGDNVWIGPRVSIISMNHDADNYHRYLDAAPVRIGDNCWLASNAVILPEVVLGAHTVVAAGSVVTRSFPEGNQLLAGVPARVIRQLGEYQPGE